MQADTLPKRYTTISLPGRKYIPGQGVHPDKDPRGSHIPEYASTTTKFNAGNWQYSQQYLYAIDLFNNGFWWEAHEVLENLWIESGRKSAAAKFIQGIIQISAALLKHSQSLHRGAVRLMARGLSKIRLQSGSYLGIDVEKFANEVELFINNGSSAYPTIILPGL